MTVDLDRLIFFDCFSKRAHLRRPGQLIRSTRGADQGSVDRQDHGRESQSSSSSKWRRLAQRPLKDFAAPAEMFLAAGGQTSTSLRTLSNAACASVSRCGRAY